MPERLLTRRQELIANAEITTTLIRKISPLKIIREDKGGLDLEEADPKHSEHRSGKRVQEG